jgi:hypothetical protein
VIAAINFGLKRKTKAQSHLVFNFKIGTVESVLYRLVSSLGFAIRFR